MPAATNVVMAVAYSPDGRYIAAQDIAGHIRLIDVAGRAPLAVTFGGPITSRTGSLFIAIADHQFPGLGYLLRTRLMQKLPQLEQFNDSSDTGREGLAYVKSRFRPIAMNKVYQATRSE
jgi:hypothetical protein